MCRIHCKNEGLRTGDTSLCSTSAIHTGRACCSNIDHPNTHRLERETKSLNGFRPHVSIHEGVNPSRSRIRDIELGSSDLEHITLQFQGSNCPGCVSEISTALNQMTHLHNSRINAILMQIDFEIDVEKCSASDVIKSVQRATGRSCHRIADGMQELDLLIPAIEGGSLDLALPQGVRDITRLKKDTYRVRYNATVIGARQLLKVLGKNLENPQITLAPPISHNETPPDIRMSVYKTSLSFALTCPILVLSWAPLPNHPIAYGAVSLALASVIQILIAGPFYNRALRSLMRNRRIDMDILIVLSTSLAYSFSIASFVCEVEHTSWSSGLYFETSALLISFIMAGRLMSDFACHRSLKSIEVKSLQPQVALLGNQFESQGMIESEIDARLLQFGDTFKVKRDCPAVTDGKTLSGSSIFDEGIITGEARLVNKAAGAAVTAGSINRGDDILVELTRIPGQNTIDEIAHLVESVTHSKPKVQQIADKIAAWIVPVVSILALTTLATWSVVGVLALHKPIGSSILNAVPYTIAVLVVTCPCALVLAVPIVLIVASSVGVKKGIVFRSAEALQVAKNVTHVVFDKTGTLTEYQLSVVSEEYCSESQSLTAALVLALTRQSKHPVSCAISKHLESAGHVPLSIIDVQSVIGNGMECVWNGQIVRVGNPRWLGVEESSAVQELFSKSLSVLCVTRGGLLTATYGLRASLREDAPRVIARLMERGISVSILSGDELGSVHEVATRLKIDPDNTKARCTPLYKQQCVKSLIEKHGNTILFCGDGINDAAALSQASLGIQVHNSTSNASVSQNTADAVLLTPSLSGILILLELSADTHRQIISSLTWAAVYNFFAILLAAGAFVNVRLPAEYAGLGEAVSVLPVILMPLCLKWRRYD